MWERLKLSETELDSMKNGTIHDCETSTDTKQAKEMPMFPSYRLGVGLIGLFGTVCSFASQGLTGASLLTMLRTEDNFMSVGNADLCGDNCTTSNVTDFGSNVTKIAASKSPWRYSWRKETQGWVLSSYFIGYYVIQFPLGWLAHRYGPKRVCLAGSFFLGCLQGVVIATAGEDPTLFIITMVLAGLGNGTMIICIASVCSIWSPPQENTRMATIIYSGLGLGTSFIFGLSAITSRVTLLGGWPWNCITVGAMTLVFCTLWGVFVSDTPANNRWVSLEERAHIEESLASHGCKASPRRNIPWRRILSSLPLWAVTIAQFGQDWLSYCIITMIPIYFKYVRRMDTDAVNMLAGLPFLGSPVMGMLASTVIDKLRNKQIVSTLLLRKISVFMGLPVSGSLLLIMTFQTEDDTVGIAVLFTMAVWLMTGFAGCGWLANQTELSPEHTSIVASVSQIVAMSSSFIAPLVLTALTPNNSVDEWRVCFGVIAGVSYAAFVLYALLASDKYQNWNSEESELIVSKGTKMVK